MSLVKKPTLTEKKIAANRRNGSQFREPVTAEGEERIGAAQLRHGSYAKPQGTGRNVKNERTSGDVHENTVDMTKCILQECPFLHENTSNKRQSTEICRTYWPNMQKLQEKARRSDAIF
jgi:hypothetical protein